MESEIHDVEAAGPQADLERADAVAAKPPGGPPGARDRPGVGQRRGEMGPRHLEPAPERGARDRGRARRLAAQEPGGGGGLLGSHPPAASSSSSSESSPEPTSASTSSKVKRYPRSFAQRTCSSMWSRCCANSSASPASLRRSLRNRCSSLWLILRLLASLLTG